MQACAEQEADGDDKQGAAESCGDRMSVGSWKPSANAVLKLGRSCRIGFVLCFGLELIEPLAGQARHD